MGIGVIAAIALLVFALVGLQALAVSDSGDEVGIDGIEREMEGDVGEMAVAASAVTNSINYQGRLTDSAGEPLSGTYRMTFRLYDVASGGTALDEDTHTVVVTEGLFNTYINIDPSYFDGRELWLGITVKGDSEMTPRQELRPVPYALSLRPGAVINGSSLDCILKVENTYVGKGTGTGVRAYSANGYGVYGKGKYGGYFTTNQGGSFGDHNAGVNMATTYDYSDGVSAQTSGDSSWGVSAQTAGDFSYGVFALTYGNHSDGFSAQTAGDDSDGVRAYTSGNYSNGVYAYSAKGYGVYGRSGGEYGGYFTTDLSDGTGLYAMGGPNGYAADFRGNVRIRNFLGTRTVMELGEGLDYAEGFDVSDLTKINPGTVLIIDPDNPGKLTMSDKPYDSKVAGIVAGAKGQGSGVRLGSDQFDYDVALAGRVYCNVDTTEAGVEPGDLLTTSATQGYAMKAIDYERAQGAILGKAMERREEGEKGQILVLVTLQ